MTAQSVHYIKDVSADTGNGEARINRRCGKNGSTEA